MKSPLSTWIKPLTAVFVVSRLIYAAVGVRFISGGLQGWQLIDPELLQNKLLESTYFLHSQPPAFNLLTGTVLKLFPDHSSAVFHGLLVVCGFALYLAQFCLMNRLGVSPRIAFAISTWFAVSPSLILYENWYFYTLPLAALMMLAALALLDFVEHRRLRSGSAFFWLLALISYTQSTFHPVTVLLTAAALLVCLPDHRRQLRQAAAVPLLLVLALSLKNATLFGNFGSSSWLGMSLARVVLVNVPEAERRSLVERGQLSEVALIEPFSPVENYPESFQRVQGFQGISVLRDVRKSTGETNHNHLAFLAISKQYLADSLRVIRSHPSAYLKGVARSFFVYTKSTSDYGWLIDNRRRVAALDELYNRLFYGRIRVQLGYAHVRGASGEPFDVYLLLILGLPLLLMYGLWLGVSRSKLATAPTRAQRCTLIFMCGCILYVACVGNAFESGENNRFRFMTDGFSFCLLALLAEHTFRMLRTRWPRLMVGSPGTDRDGRSAP